MIDDSLGIFIIMHQISLLNLFLSLYWMSICVINPVLFLTPISLIQSAQFQPIKGNKSSKLSAILTKIALVNNFSNETGDLHQTLQTCVTWLNTIYMKPIVYQSYCTIWDCCEIAITCSCAKLALAWLNCCMQNHFKECHKFCSMHSIN